MTTRQALDRAVLRVTGKDIRLVGNWSKLWCLRDYAAEIAAELAVDPEKIEGCRDITEILNLIEGSTIFHAEREETPFLL